ncbi:hypothetical protein phiK7B1_052 [Pseudomonas phage phiK7B1]|nr:hypothetical protein phiK7B1_052 [Pseudomonas phage phiK7B1]UIS24613.1 hypothetical protein S21ZY_051 [Pseudomonas phage ZY21]
MKKLWSGDDSTLEAWREIARLAFGEESAAVKYLDGRIEQEGPGAEVTEEMSEMNLLLATIHDHPETLDK